MSADFLGSGWAFPVRPDKTGAIAASTYEDNVKESIQLILGTVKGERQMRPDFGCGIHELVFAKNDMATAGLAAYHVEQALIRWEPRIELLRVDAAPDREVAGGGRLRKPEERARAADGYERSDRLVIRIVYRVIATNSIFNLVYPFYLTEGVGGG